MLIVKFPINLEHITPHLVDSFRDIYAKCLLRLNSQLKLSPLLNAYNILFQRIKCDTKAGNKLKRMLL